MQACQVCGVTFSIISGEDPPFLRNPCTCEVNQRCYRFKQCRRTARQVFLEEDGITVASYRCNEHGVEDAFEEVAKPSLKIRIEKQSFNSTGLPPIDLTKPFKLDGVTTGRIRSKDGPNLSNTPKSPPLSDEEAYAILEAELKKEPVDKKTLLRCTYCQKDHTPDKRKWVRDVQHGRRCLSSTCPKCNKSGYVAIL